MTKKELENLRNKLKPAQLDIIKKDWLRGYVFGKEKIDGYLQEIEYHKSRLNALALNYSGDAVQHEISKPENTWVSVIENIDSLVENLKAEYNATAKRGEEIVKAIEELSDERQKTILIWRYVNGMEWNEIINKGDMWYSEPSLYKIHHKAIRNLEISQDVIDTFLLKKYR